MATAERLQAMKASGERIAVLTCYDAPTARWEEEAGVDVIFVGDSVGTNVLGYASEVEVTMEDMVHHLKAVQRGVRSAYLLVDLPYGSVETTSDTLENARRLIALGADGVKLEGFRPEQVRALSEHGLNVWCHLGLNPQIHKQKGLRAKTLESATELVIQACELQDAGASFLVLEAVPEEVAKVVTERLTIPTIGIAAGRHTDGQVLVVPDLLGGNDFELRHASSFADFRGEGIRAIRRYVEEVKATRFPEERHVRHMSDEERARLHDWDSGST